MHVTKPENKTHVLKARSITKKYGDQYVLKDVSFTVNRGDMVGVIGPNGAGKSTLMNIVLGFDQSYTGEVSISENERIAYIPQLVKTEQFVMPLSVREFLRIAANRYYISQGKTHEDDLVGILKHVGLDRYILSQDFHSLSGGQRQRVALARALLGEPTLLILDEPLASVDFPARVVIYDLLQHINEKHEVTIMLVSHDVESIIGISHSVLCLNQTIHKGCHPIDFIEQKRDTQSAKVVEHVGHH